MLLLRFAQKQNGPQNCDDTPQLEPSPACDFLVLVKPREEHDGDETDDSADHQVHQKDVQSEFSQVFQNLNHSNPPALVAEPLELLEMR